MSIQYVNLSARAEERQELLPILDKVFGSGQYIGGQIVEDFERKAASVCEVKHCVALNSGTDALLFGLSVIGVGRGDEVLTPPNSFIASTSAIIHVGATPKFVDVLPDQNMDPSKIEAAITSRTKAIMPVHLTGRMARMDEIEKIAIKHNLLIIEDAAQSIGSKYNNIPSGKWGKVGCFSAHPLKNLNACGDAGFLVTDDDEIASRIRLMRNHGLVDRNVVSQFGFVSRMDAIQAAILLFRLEKLPQLISARRKNAQIYRQNLDPEFIFAPPEGDNEFNSYHTFVIQVENRDRLKKRLEMAGIETSIHYPIPIHLQPAAEKLGYKLGNFPAAEFQAEKILTLPINQFLSPNEISFIAQQVNILVKD